MSEEKAEYQTGNKWPMHLEDVCNDLSADLITALASPVLWPSHKTSGIYFLLDDNEIVYVGKSTNLKARFDQHAKTDKTYNRYFYIFCDEKELSKVEAYFILRFRPKYNVAMPREWNCE